MKHVFFWIVWVLVGYAGANTWLAATCPPAACSMMLVALQLPQLIVPFIVWLLGGIAVSVFMASRSALPPTQQAVESTPQPTNPEAAPASLDDLGKQYGISFDGEKYQYGEYRYDKLVDAVNYAKLSNRRA